MLLLALKMNADKIAVTITMKLQPFNEHWLPTTKIYINEKSDTGNPRYPWIFVALFLA